MIHVIDDLPAGCIGVRVIGVFSTDDYNDTIDPMVDDVVERHEQLRLVLHLGQDFEGFGDGAWGELTDQIRHIHFHRGAVVTDDSHLSTAINVMKWTLHGHVRTFHDAEYDKAVGWVAG